ncbi:hypothetical protein BN7_4623 [Wickerhamomyces ciferrii]|uniref:Uncharacterized protein n=1 Tax=Wickerhamomyces ciferrii (strain ATCC 14091 / BCRC 22168 / CBS 111 / JCM 3599 / NBRC 0793 / NRRL Y-1031 F-60-10) TaxID=1206466 RepID=K0KIJ8_WICCF|nr:uncharacterized protein BN7_4623 [Wickerhamomyces ciferrii]CCH45045.1 hypothetical protein BN7_4623 [Wickerhamomyces ciferrii]
MVTLDSKDKKYASAVEKALGFFNTVEEWADCISFLSKLLKALQQKHTTPHWIPHDIKISTTLSKCLSPNLPSGVHQKTIEVYVFIFNELGVDALAKDVNIWIPGILPIMQFASISIKSVVIDLYKNHLLTLPPSVLKNLIKPILSYLIPSIDDERSEFFDASIGLIERLKTELGDDSLFWQSLFLIMITSEERRLGCLVWCNKKLPDLNVIIPPPEDSKDDTPDYYKEELKKKLNSEQLALITPEPGLLVRSYIATLKSDNILIQRGFLDLMIKKLNLNSTVLQKISPAKDLQSLIISTIGAVLKKDMSINRRIWSWLLGPEGGDIKPVDFFQQNASEHLIDGLLKYFQGKYGHQPSYTQKLIGYKICLAIMDRWEIGSQVVPQVLVPLLKSVYDSKILPANEFNELLKSASALFDAVETLTIWSTLVKLVDDQNIDFLIFILQNFAVQDEEMLVHQFPLFFIATLIINVKTESWYKLLDLCIGTIPQRAYLPIEHSNPEIINLTNEEVAVKIDEYYQKNDSLALPFNPADLAKLTLNIVTNLAVENSKKNDQFDYIALLNNVIDTIPELNFHNDQVIEIIKGSNFEGDTLLSLTKLFPKLQFDAPFSKIEILRSLVFQLCSLLLNKGYAYQVETVKALSHLSLNISSNYIEAAVSAFLLDLPKFGDRLTLFNYIWIHTTESTLLDRPLHIILDELRDANHPNYDIVQNWILGNINIGLINRLFQLVASKLNESVNDKLVFTYHCSILLNVLKVDTKRMLPLFTEELSVINSVEYKDEDVSTYKEFTLYALGKYLDTGTFDANANRVVFKLVELLLDGREKNFDQFVSKAFALSQDFIIYNSESEDFKSISIVLLDHLKELIKMPVVTRKEVSVFKIQADKQQSPFFEFLLSSFVKFNKSELLSSWTELLVTSFKHQDDAIFFSAEAIVMAIINKVNIFFYNDSESKDDVSISLLLGVLQELLSLVRTYVLSIEVNSPRVGNNDPGFFSSVVSGVLGDSSKNNNLSDESKNRQMVNSCFKEATRTCYEIWSTSDYTLKLKADSNPNLSVKYQSLKLKHRSKNLLEKLCSLEFNEVLKSLIAIYGGDETSSVFKLLNVLDVTRPQLSLPHIFQILSISLRNTNKQQKPNSFDVSYFLVLYLLSLQNDSMEDIYDNSINFLREVASDLNSYKQVLINIVKFTCVLAQKLKTTTFGSQKRIKKELGDLFVKILPASLNYKNIEISNALASSINDSDSTKTDGLENSSSMLTSSATLEAPGGGNQEELYTSIQWIVPKLNAVVTEADKLNAAVSTIMVNLITPNLKTRNFPKNISIHNLELLGELSKEFSDFKSLKFQLSEVFNDQLFFDVEHISYWNLIMKNWIKNDSSDKISEYLNKLTSSGTANIFNWSENEQIAKSMALKRITYLLLISEQDQHIVLLKEIFSKLDLIIGQSLYPSPEIFLVIRSVLLKFSPIHLYDYWTMIYTTLQQFFLKLLDADKNEISKINLNSIFQASKLLDLILVLKFEDFQEWIFIIDTINAIYKNVNIISLIDKLSLKDEIYETTALTTEKSELLSKLSESKGLRKPALIGIRDVSSLSVLKPFFDGLSYFNYENIYNGHALDHEACEEDMISDLFLNA